MWQILTFVVISCTLWGGWCRGMWNTPRHPSVTTTDPRSPCTTDPFEPTSTSTSNRYLLLMFYRFLPAHWLTFCLYVYWAKTCIITFKEIALGWRTCVHPSFQTIHLCDFPIEKRRNLLLLCIAYEKALNMRNYVILKFIRILCLKYSYYATFAFFS